jgi:hypothetical protein
MTRLEQPARVVVLCSTTFEGKGKLYRRKGHEQWHNALRLALRFDAPGIKLGQMISFLGRSRLALTAVSAVLLGSFGLAACSSPNASPPQPGGSDQATTTSTAVPTATTSQPAFTSIGTATIPFGASASIVVSYSVGSPIAASSSGAIPSAASSVFSACSQPGVFSSADASTLVYLPGHISITYQGPMSTGVTLNPTNDPTDLTNGNPLTASNQFVEDLDVNGNWICGNYDSAADGFTDTVQMSSGESLTYPAWFIAGGVLSSSYPTFTPSDFSYWGVSGRLVTLESQYFPMASAGTFSGPNATAGCTYPSSSSASNGGISLLSSTPFTVNLADSPSSSESNWTYQGSFSCQGPGAAGSSQS